MTIPNEPAGRLLALFKQARQQNTGAALGTEWSKVFGLSWPEDYPILARRIAELVALPDQIKSRVEAAALEDEEILLRYIGKIEQAMSHFHSLTNSLGNQLDLLRPEVEYSLEMCSRTLKRLSAEGQLDEEHLDRIQILVIELIDEVYASELDEDLEDFLLTNLRAIQRGLREARIGGIARVEQALDQAVGSAVRRADVVARMREEKPAMAKRFGSILAQLALVVGVSSGLAQLPGQVKAMLELGDDPAPAVVVVIQETRAGPSNPPENKPAAVEPKAPKSP